MSKSEKNLQKIDYNNEVMMLQQVVIVYFIKILYLYYIRLYTSILIILQHCHSGLFTNEELPNPLIKKLEFLFQNNKTGFLNRGKSLPSLR